MESVRQPVGHRARFLGLFLVAVGGCGGGVPLHTASGKVVFPDGSPVTSGVVEFAPAEGGPSARGEIGTDGRFVLKTGDAEGAVAGTHRVIVVQGVLADGAPQHARHPHTRKSVHRRHADFQSSGIEKVVRADVNNTFEIRVIPAR